MPSHIPILLRPVAGKPVLIGYVARANDQWRHFDGKAEALAIFPWATRVHLTHVVLDLACPAYVELRGRSRLWEATCTRRGPWRMEDLASDLYEKLARAIVVFEMPIDRIEGKFKLGQNRSQDDRVGMLEGIDAEKSPDAEALAAFIRETLKND